MLEDAKIRVLVDDLLSSRNATLYNLCLGEPGSHLLSVDDNAIVACKRPAITTQRPLVVTPPIVRFVCFLFLSPLQLVFCGFERPGR